MPDSTTLPRLIRFGVFEVDLRSGELRKNGLNLRLRGQPFEVLTMLLERPGEIVTREELQKRLWPADTFVDFDHSLNTAVNKIREVLGDSAETPRYVETIPRRGYRFIYPVDVGATRGVPTGREAAPRPYTRRLVTLAAVIGTTLAIVVVLLALNVAGLRGRLMTAVGARRAVPLAKIESIAVLPLENLSRDPEQEYFADGMTDALITDLGKISALRVISRTSAMHYKGTKKRLPEIAKELNVDAIVEGTVQRSGDRVRITANLLHAPTDRHLWAESYERDLRDVLALQSEVARAIAEQVRINLTPEEHARLTTTRPVNPEAYEAYLRGFYLGENLTIEAQLRAIKYLQEAIQKDPSFAPAYATMARCQAALAVWEYPPAREDWQKAVDMARKALQLDEKLAEIYTVYAEKKYFADWDWSGGLAEFRRAREMDPGNAIIIYHYGVGLEIVGHVDEAIREYTRAVQLDPRSHVANLFLASALFNAHHDERAIEQYRKMLDLDPNNADPHLGLGSVYETMGRYDDAVAAYLRGTSLRGDSGEKVQACRDAYKAGGIRGFWRKRLEYLKAEAKRGTVSPLTFADFHVRTGEKEQALGWLEKAYQERIGDLVWVKADRTWDPLRSDPRFQDLLRRMNFPP